MKIAVLLTCFNRREQSLRCLSSLFSIIQKCDIYLVDDGSTDGTFDAIRANFPQVKLIKGDGSLFWNRGMHLAWENAATSDYDFYIWLNDDVVLYRYFLQELLECELNTGEPAIISGIIENESKDEILYGGSSKDRKLIKPNGEIQEITYLNGNVVLISRQVFKLLGNLDPVYHHDLGDVDYGLRALARNIKVLSTRRPIAYGEKNYICRERLNGANIIGRFKRLYSPLGSSPKINYYFRKRHKSTGNAIGYYIFQHLLNIIPDNVNFYIFGKKYQ